MLTTLVVKKLMSYNASPRSLAHLKTCTRRNMH